MSCSGSVAINCSTGGGTYICACNDDSCIGGATRVCTEKGGSARIRKIISAD
jgi:hypothetical protein